MNTTGIYSTVRHPLYLGNFFILLGPCIYTGNSYAVIIFILVFWIYYERIMFAEEAYLKSQFNAQFQEWSARVPLIIPSFKIYIASKGHFLFSRILDREYTGICGVFFMYTILIVIRNYFDGNEELISPGWKIMILLFTLLYITLRTIKKKKGKHLRK